MFREIGTARSDVSTTQIARVSVRISFKKKRGKGIRKEEKNLQLTRREISIAIRVNNRLIRRQSQTLVHLNHTRQRFLTQRFLDIQGRKRPDEEAILRPEDPALVGDGQGRARIVDAGAMLPLRRGKQVEPHGAEEVEGRPVRLDGGRAGGILALVPKGTDAGVGLVDADEGRWSRSVKHGRDVRAGDDGFEDLDAGVRGGAAEEGCVGCSVGGSDGVL